MVGALIETLKEWAVETVGVALFCYAVFLAAVWCVFC